MKIRKLGRLCLQKTTYSFLLLRKMVKGWVGSTVAGELSVQEASIPNTKIPNPTRPTASD